MRLVNYESPRGPRTGAIFPPEEQVIDLLDACGAEGSTERIRSALISLEALIEAGPSLLRDVTGSVASALERGVACSPFESVTLLPPLTRPNSLRDFIAFEDHARAGAGRRNESLNPSWYERPIYYKGNHRSLVGGGELHRPSFTDELDFELEVGAIVGSQVRDADPDEASRAIFGFTILNDWSARDIQRAEMASRLGPAKGKDFATSIGPCIVTVDEVGPRPAFEMSARVNGVTVCEANLSKAHWDFPAMISYVSMGETVWPTDIYGSGTPFGGCMLDQGGPYLQPGDVVELEVSGIGILRNTII